MRSRLWRQNNSCAYSRRTSTGPSAKTRMHGCCGFLTVPRTLPARRASCTSGCMWQRQVTRSTYQFASRITIPCAPGSRPPRCCTTSIAPNSLSATSMALSLTTILRASSRPLSSSRYSQTSSKFRQTPACRLSHVDIFRRASQRTQTRSTRTSLSRACSRRKRWLRRHAAIERTARRFSSSSASWAAALSWPWARTAASSASTSQTALFAAASNACSCNKPARACLSTSARVSAATGWSASWSTSAATAWRWASRVRTVPRMSSRCHRHGSSSRRPAALNGSSTPSSRSFRRNS